MEFNHERIKALLSGANLSPNKALGQNFFLDDALLAATAADFAARGENVLEIGAGLGALTAPLLAVGANVWAVEKDAALAALLPDALGEVLASPAAGRLTVLHADALKCDLSFVTSDFLAAGNLPYYITTPLCERLLKLRPRRLLLMVQREAGERFLAKPSHKNYGTLSILSQLYYTTRQLAALPPESYWPQPTVDSVLLLLDRRADAPALPPAAFAAFIDRCLLQRRKTLKNNLKELTALPDALTALGLNADVRGEALSPEMLYRLYQLLFGAA